MGVSLDDLRGPECFLCGASLEGKRSDAVFCSYDCFMVDYERLKQAACRDARRGRACSHCGQTISVERTAKAIYCSDSCQQKARYRRNKMAPCVCRTCGNDFLGRLPTDRYCSPDCRRAEGLRVRALSWKPKMICERCGSPFKARPGGRHCSQKCRMAAQLEEHGRAVS